MLGILLTIHITVSVLLILIVLLQTSQSSGLGGLLGGSSDSLFGSSRGTALGKITTYLAIFFMAMTLILAMISGRGGFKTAGVSIPADKGATPLDKTIAKDEERIRQQQTAAQQQAQQTTQQNQPGRAQQPAAGVQKPGQEAAKKQQQNVNIPLPQEETQQVPNLDFNKSEKKK